MKTVVASLLSKGGWIALRLRTLLQDKAVILMYHRVLPQDAVEASDIPIQPGMYVTPESFRMHLSYLLSRFSIISLELLVNRIQTGKDVSGYCAITFDDGWRDNHQYAFPIIQKFKVPVTIFLATGFVGSDNWFWPEEVAWCVAGVFNKKIPFALFPAELSDIINPDHTSRKDMEKQIDQSIEHVKSLSVAQRSAVVGCCKRLRKNVCGGTDARLLMNWDEIREMVRSGLVTLGTHTVAHALLDQLPGEEVRQELIESTAQIQRETGRNSGILSYPNGNYSPSVLSLLPEVGVAAAVTTNRGWVNNASRVYELPRVAVHEDVSCTLPLFQWRLLIR